MEVKNKTMFHIHTSNQYDELWQEGNELVIDNNFNSICGLSIAYFNTDIICSNDELASLEGYLKSYLTEGVENLDINLIKKLLEDSYRIIYNAKRCKCEAALEICRRKKFKSYPSRLHSIWVTDKDNLDYWLNILTGKTIFELELTGILFKTSDLYIPDSHLSLGESIDIAETYWNPIFTREALDKREYLFQGKALIKRKIQ